MILWYRKLYLSNWLKITSDLQIEKKLEMAAWPSIIKVIMPHFLQKKKKHFSLEVTRKRCTISIQYFWVKKRFYNWFFFALFSLFLKIMFFYWLYCPMNFDQFWTSAEVRVKKNGRPLLFLLIPRKIVS